ncbi:hypothetical protein [Paracoccus aminophilus]|uniref:Uncharacterized protein n=1 Tax=Paracoccus aminophilus JCM 7686 TaxID=1367847 RepID=S5XKQ0_PARAH|nr:hypothetical protein [Paracoccus aminophilus]AGT07794.1 hypothetical protein JCM7686_0685 [Paracoccus aminophilus JCM 7686]
MDVLVPVLTFLILPGLCLGIAAALRNLVGVIVSLGATAAISVWIVVSYLAETNYLRGLWLWGLMVLLGVAALSGLIGWSVSHLRAGKKARKGP